MRARAHAYMKSLRFRILLIVLLCGLLPITVLGTYIGAFFLAPLRAKTLAEIGESALREQSRAQVQIEAAINEAKSVTYDGTLERATHALNEGKLGYQNFYRDCRAYLDMKFLRSPFFTYSVFFTLNYPEQMIYTASAGPYMPAFTQNTLPQLLTMSEGMDTRSLFFSCDGQLYLARKLYNQQLKPFGMIAWAVTPSTLFAPFYEPDRLWEGRVDVRLDQYIQQGGTQDKPIPWGEETLGNAEHAEEFIYTGRAVTRDYELAYRLHIDKHAVYGQTERFIALLALLVLLLLLVMLGTMWFIHIRFSLPVRELAVAAERLENGELGITVPTLERNELGKLSQSFNQMSTQLKNLVEHAYKEELILRDARIEALQSRINPHFLNNTLEMMNWQARIEGSESIAHMIDALSTLLDASLDRSDRRVVMLKEEMMLTDAYLYFIKLRYGDRLEIQQELDESLLEHTVPRLVLQSLLENAIEHGIAPVGGGRIVIRVYRLEEALRIEVVNDGRRLTAADQARIAGLLAKEDRDLRSEHLGIRNVHQRLKLIYSPDAGLTLEADENGDTLARISIPFKQF